MTASSQANPSLTVVVLTLNEEHHLEACLASALAFTDRVLVLDSGSEDRTVEIAARHEVTVRQRAFTGFAEQRNAALEMIETEWVLFLDADETVPIELTREIREALSQHSTSIDGYWIPRRNYLGNRQLRGGGWWPDYQLRLFRRDRGHYDRAYPVHERLLLSGKQSRLTNHLVHHNFGSLREFHAAQRRYLDLLVTQHVQQGDFGRRRTVAGRPVREFVRRFITLRGYRDGVLGAYLAAAMGWYEFQLWRRVRRLAADSPEPPSEPVRTCPAIPDAAGDVDVSLIIVSHNTNELLQQCLASIEAWFEATDAAAEVIVVDNASTDGTPDMVRRRFPDVRLISNHDNRGFARANNQGILAAQGRYLALLNPDTTIIGDAFGILTDYLDHHGTVALAGPRLIYPDGSTQPSRRRFPTRLTGFVESTLIQDWWGDNHILRHYYMQDRPGDRTHDVDWLVGACLVIRREAIQQAGLLDERYFMYAEEIEWCHRFKQHGWRVIYHPQAQITHHEGASSSQNFPARQINFDTSKVLLFEQLHGKLTARSLHLFLLGTYLTRILIESGKGIIGHKRPLRRQRVWMYCHVLAARIRGAGKRGAG